MKVILTGASGFLGKYIYQELSITADIITISRKDAVINIDLSTTTPELPPVDLVVHAAGKAHSVPKTEEEKQAFFDVNFLGTANLLKGLEESPELPKSFVFISTVAVYGKDAGVMISENSPLNAKDAYGKSKIQAELLVTDWCRKNRVICTILRLPLLVGENPPGNLGSMLKGIRAGYYFNIAGGKARKSMVLAIDVAKTIPRAAKIGGVFNLTDAFHPSFKELSAAICEQIGKPRPFNIPLWLAKILAIGGNVMGKRSPINSEKLKKICADLTFDDGKAKRELNWKPNPVLEGLRLI